MTNIIVDTSVTMEGGFHPALIKSGPFTGTAFVIQDVQIDENTGRIDFQYNVVRGDIMVHQQREFEEVVQKYVKDCIQQIIQEDSNLDH